MKTLVVDGLRVCCDDTFHGLTVVLTKLKHSYFKDFSVFLAFFHKLQTYEIFVYLLINNQRLLLIHCCTFLTTMNQQQQSLIFLNDCYPR